MAGDRWYLFVTVEAEAGGAEAADFRFQTPTATDEPFALGRERHSATETAWN